MAAMTANHWRWLHLIGVPHCPVCGRRWNAGLLCGDCLEDYIYIVDTAQNPCGIYRAAYGHLVVWRGYVS